MLYLTRKKVKNIVLIAILISLLHIYGVFVHLFEKDFDTEFHYPYDGDIELFVQQLKNNITPEVKPINSYNFQFSKNCNKKCARVQNLRLVYIIKSSPEHQDRRIAIRSYWGFERRFSDVEIRTVFLIGITNVNKTQSAIDDESRKYGDIVQANFTDTYYNNTYKTMMGFEWAVKFCPNSKFYMFVDDDYYVSTKNVLRFVRYPTNYPQYLKEPMANVKSLFNRKKPLQVLDFDLEDDVRLYTGYAFKSSPLRHYPSTWYISLSEYPYDKWPPYVTAGAYILSREALRDMYYASFFTQHFRFDDIYVALLAYKVKIEPLHCEEFYYYKQKFDIRNYEFTIASHGYEDPEELMKVWTYQKSMGYA